MRTSGFDRLIKLRATMEAAVKLYGDREASRDERAFALHIGSWLDMLQDGLDDYVEHSFAKEAAERELEELREKLGMVPAQEPVDA